MLNNELNALRSSLGNNGGILLTDTTAITGEFVGLIALEDSVFTTLTTPEFTKNGTLTALTGADWGTVTAGTTILHKYRDWETDRKSTRLNSSHRSLSRMPSSA